VSHPEYQGQESRGHEQPASAGTPPESLSDALASTAGITAPEERSPRPGNDLADNTSTTPATAEIPSPADLADTLEDGSQDEPSTLDIIAYSFTYLPEQDRHVVTGDATLDEIRARAKHAIGPENFDAIDDAHIRLAVAGLSESPEHDVAVVDPHAGDKEFFAEVEAYATTAASVGLSPDTAATLAVTSMEGVAVGFTDPERLLVTLGRAVEATADPDGQVTDNGVAGIVEVIERTKDFDVVEPGLALYDAAIRAGLSPAASVEVIANLTTSGDYQDVRSTIEPYRDMLHVLKAVPVEASLAAALVRGIEATDPMDRPGVCYVVQTALMHVIGHTDTTPTEMLTAVQRRLNEGHSLLEAVTSITTEHPELTSGRGEAMKHVDPNRQYTETTGPLRHSPLPYQVQRSWGEGMADLTKLANAKQARGEDVAEGQWVYAQGKWYSMGGETIYIGNSASMHSAARYDMSRLGGDPYSVHVHPADLAEDPAGKFLQMLPHRLDFTWAVTEIADASQPVTGLRSFIVHGLGVTELTLGSQNPATILQIASRLADITSRVISRMGGPSVVAGAAWEIGDQKIAQYIVNRVNEVLPPGFNIKLYPPGTDFEAIASGEA